MPDGKANKIELETDCDYVNLGRVCAKRESTGASDEETSHEREKRLLAPNLYDCALAVSDFDRPDVLEQRIQAGSVDINAPTYHYFWQDDSVNLKFKSDQGLLYLLVDICQAIENDIRPSCAMTVYNPSWLYETGAALASKRKMT